jgi:hypothetical protein
VIDAVARQVDGPILGKPPLSRIDCSRIIVSVNGQQYAPHHGESVWKAYGLKTAGINLVQGYLFGEPTADSSPAPARARGAA